MTVAGKYFYQFLRIAERQKQGDEIRRSEGSIDFAEGTDESGESKKSALKCYLRCYQVFHGVIKYVVSYSLSLLLFPPFSVPLPPYPCLSAFWPISYPALLNARTSLDSHKKSR
jgi:hypothetical protein